MLVMWLLAIVLMILLGWAWVHLRRLRVAQERLRQEAVTLRHDLLHLAHDVLTPSQVVQALADEHLGPLQERPLSRAQWVAIRDAAGGLSGAMRNLSMWLVPPRTPSLGPVNLIALLDALVSERLGVAMAKGLHLEFRAEPHCPHEVEVDASLLFSVLENLLDHCLSITREGHVEITLHESAGQNIHLSVLDSGPPLSATTTSLMFEPFGLVRCLAGSHPPGSGLNLHIARSVIRTLGGDLTATTRSTPGTLFTLHFPAQSLSRLERTPAANVVASNDPYARHRANVPSMRILVVEDQASNAAVIVSALTRAGHDTVVAGDGDSALAHLSSPQAFDAAIVDIGLPDTSGLDVIKLSRLYQTDRPHPLPVVVLTGQLAERVRQDCFSAGAWAFLSKPLSTQRLLESIAAVHERMAQLHNMDPVDLPDVHPSAALRQMLLPNQSQRAIEGMRDILRYQRDVDALAEAGDWTTLIDRIHAIRGAAHLLGADRIEEACRAITSTYPGPRPAQSWPSLQRELSIRVADLWRSLSRVPRTAR